MYCDFLFGLLSWTIHSWISHLPYWVDTQLKRFPHGKQQMFSNNHINELKVDPFIDQAFQFWPTLERPRASLSLLPHLLETCEMSNLYCFKLLNFGVVTNQQCNHGWIFIINNGGRRKGSNIFKGLKEAAKQEFFIYWNHSSK